MRSIQHTTRLGIVEAIVMFMILAIGCSKDDLTGALDKAKNAVSENATKAKEGHSGIGEPCGIGQM